MMTDQEINIIIGERCGWHPHPDNDKKEQKFWTYGGSGYGLPNGELKRSAASPPIHDGFWGKVASLPNYCGDLNAMNEAKQTLSLEKRAEFIDVLCEIIKRDEDRYLGPHSLMTKAFFASSRQQAKAFLAIGEDRK